MQMSASALKIRSAPALPRCLLKAWAKADSNRPLSRQDAGERPARNPMSDQSLPAQGADIRHENVSDRYKTVTSSILATTFQSAAVYSGESAFASCAQAKRDSQEGSEEPTSEPQSLM